MKRFTIHDQTGVTLPLNVCTISEVGITGEAIELLAKFETMVETMLHQQQQISQQLELLRQAKKEKTVTFRELATTKMINHQLLIQLCNYHLINQEDL